MSASTIGHCRPSLAGETPETRWRIPERALETSYTEMAADGRRDREGIVLWAGRRETATPELATITHVLLLRGNGIVRARGLIRIAPELLNAVTDRLAALGDDVYLVGQIHGHPPHSSTDLSWTDVMYGIRVPQYLSIVAPAYGMRRPAALRDCGVHIFDSGAGWRRLPLPEVDRRVQIDVATFAEVVTVGDDIEIEMNAGADISLWLPERRLAREDL